MNLNKVGFFIILLNLFLFCKNEVDYFLFWIVDYLYLGIVNIIFWNVDFFIYFNDYMKVIEVYMEFFFRSLVIEDRFYVWN